MIRLRLPVVLTPEQWIGLNETAEDHSTGTIKVTTEANHSAAWYFKISFKTYHSKFQSSASGFDCRLWRCQQKRNLYSQSLESPLQQEAYELAGKISEMCLPKPKLIIMISGLMMNFW